MRGSIIHLNDTLQSAGQQLVAKVDPHPSFSYW